MFLHTALCHLLGPKEGCCQSSLTEVDYFCESVTDSSSSGGDRLSSGNMASPFVPVPLPLNRAMSGGSSKLRRPQRASSLGSVSSGSGSSTPRMTGDGRECGGGFNSRRSSRCSDRPSRSRTPPPAQSPVTRARVNGTLEPSVEYSSCPRSLSDPEGSQQTEERPITPTVLGYEVMEERAKFTVRNH